MKKIFIVLLLLSSSLFAEEFTPGYFMGFSLKQSIRSSDFDNCTITAILPYENGYIVKLTKKDMIIELYITKGFVFYQWGGVDIDRDVYTFYKHTVIDISPNKFLTKEQVYYEE